MIGLDGTYKVENVPAGQAKIAVKASSMPVAPVGPTPKGILDMSKAPPPKVFSSVQPPAKYASPNNGLVLEVKGSGRQDYDIKLAP